MERTLGESESTLAALHQQARAWQQGKHEDDQDDE